MQLLTFVLCYNMFAGETSAARTVGTSYTVETTKKAPDFGLGAFFAKLIAVLPTTALATIATSAAVATATPVTTTPPAAATIAAATATASGWARFTGARFVYGQRSAFDRLPVELGNCLLRVGLACHCHKGKSARFTSEFILHQGDFLHRSSLCKEILKISLGCVEGKISYV
jgi:hypothetical protein